MYKELKKKNNCKKTKTTKIKFDKKKPKMMKFKNKKKDLG